MREDRSADILWVVTEAVARRRCLISHIALSPNARAALDSMDPRPGVWALTSREHEILRRLAEGETTLGLAQSLGVKVSTVRTHVSSILRKLGAHTRVEAVTIAHRVGILDTRQLAGVEKR